MAHRVIETYQAINLVAPTAREVWQSLSRPSAALVTSVRAQPRQPSPNSADEPAAHTLRTAVGTVLPRRLLASWDDDTEAVPALRRVLRRWCDLARNSTGDRREVARLTLAAAMLARGAILDGDTATVKWFVNRWLGLRATDSRVDGASAALLEDSWVCRRVDDEFSAVRDTVTDLRIEAAYQHRLHRPVWETQLRGAAVGSLDDLMEPSGGIVLPDVLKDDGGGLFTAVSQTLLKEQMQSILQTLSKREAHVVIARATGKTFVQLEGELSINRKELSRIEKHAIKKLRHPSRSQFLRDYLD